jgi:hypothetical protein
VNANAMSIDDFDFLVRREVYDVTIRTGRVPAAPEVASALTEDVDDVRASFARLAAARVLVLDDDRNIVMAAPFSGVPTLFTVLANGISYFANCIWDALGVAAMLQADARIETTCDDCGTASSLRVENGAVVGDGIVHFAVPARRWWDDILFT